MPATPRASIVPRPSSFDASRNTNDDNRIGERRDERGATAAPRPGARVVARAESRGFTP